jgi:hypothetical protein
MIDSYFDRVTAFKAGHHHSQSRVNLSRGANTPKAAVSAVGTHYDFAVMQAWSLFAKLTQVDL